MTPPKACSAGITTELRAWLGNRNANIAKQSAE
jgi:hypothetical protein